MYIVLVSFDPTHCSVKVCHKNAVVYRRMFELQKYDHDTSLSPSYLNATAHFENTLLHLHAYKDIFTCEGELTFENWDPLLNEPVLFSIKSDTETDFMCYVDRAVALAEEKTDCSSPTSDTVQEFLPDVEVLSGLYCFWTPHQGFNADFQTYPSCIKQETVTL